MPEAKTNTGDLRDREDRPQPNLDPAEGDEDTVEESLRQHDERRRKGGQA